VEADVLLFRREAGRLVASLTRIVGLHNLALAEDVAQDALCRALEVWKFRGVPEHPSAWLMATAKNRVLHLLRQERSERKFAPELGRLLDTEWTLAPLVDEVFEPRAIRDDLLRMMFSCCHPRLPEEAQVALVLHVLCGFGVGEIASAFLCTEAAIEKRLTRAKKMLAGSRSLFDLVADDDVSTRLSAVHRALYLLFNEGYHGAHPETAVRAELCREAMYLAGSLAEHPTASTPATFALCALMSLHAARLAARLDASGNLSPFFDQDRSLWDAALVAEGINFLGRSAAGSDLTEYHVEAAIAAAHAAAPRAEDTDWGVIVSLYDTLLTIRSSPVIALSRAIAIAQRDGPERGLEEIGHILERDRLASYWFYFAALGELELQSGSNVLARNDLRAALGLARSPTERRFLEQRIEACDGDLRARA
jgi:RNA polymerase sigma factor (sigma-70 family)